MDLGLSVVNELQRTVMGENLDPMHFHGPLFVVGLPRSGTKLLRDLLNRHPAIRIPSIETELLPWLASYVDKNAPPERHSEFNRFWQLVQEHSYFVHKAREGSPVERDAWFAACRTFDAAGLFEALVRLDVGLVDRHDVIWGDKSPSYVDALPCVRKLFPASKVIHIVRDVRDYCLSMHHAWGKDMRRAAQRWSDSIEAARRESRSFAGDYMELRYEDLLSDTTRELGRVCRFLGIPFDSAMTSLARASENLGETRGQARIVTDNHGKYQLRMAAGLLRDIEALAGLTMDRLGYARAAAFQPPRRLSSLAMTRGRLRDAVALINADRKAHGIVGAMRFHFRHMLATRR